MPSNQMQAIMECGCCGLGCCLSRCNTVNEESCTNPLPTTLTCELSMTLNKPDPISGLATTCVDVAGTLELTPTRVYRGDLFGSCAGWCGGLTRNFRYTAELACVSTSSSGYQWRLTVVDRDVGDTNQRCIIGLSQDVNGFMTNESCDPIYFIGTLPTWYCSDWICVIPLLGIDEVYGDVLWDALVYETP
jgi:hypothetical protein